MTVGDLVEYLKTQDQNESLIFTFEGENLEIDKNLIEYFMYQSLFFGFYVDLDHIVDEMVRSRL